jgi:hypothetical protein
MDMEDVRHGGEQDRYSQCLLAFEHSQHYKFGQPKPCFISAHLPLINDNDTFLLIPFGHSNDLQNVNDGDILPCCKSKKYRN